MIEDDMDAELPCEEEAMKKRKPKKFSKKSYSFNT